MVAFLSAGLGLGHKDFDGYRGRLCYIRYISLTRTKVFNSIGIFVYFLFIQFYIVCS